MASTRTHDLLSMTLASAIVTVSAFTQNMTLLRLGSGVFLGLFIGPDWDWDAWLVEHKDTHKQYILLEREAREHERPVRRIYGVVARRWPPPFCWWIFVYARLFKHRKVNNWGISHHPVWGTLIRLGWAIFPPILTFANADFLDVWVGVWLSDLLHITADKYL